MARCHEVMKQRGPTHKEWVFKQKRIVTKLPDMTLDEVKGEIPKLVYAGLLLSADILLNDFLRSRDPKKQKEAALALVDKLGDQSFLKNLAQIRDEVERSQAGPDAKKKVEWKKDADEG